MSLISFSKFNFEIHRVPFLLTGIIHRSKWGLSLVVGWRSIAAAYAHKDVTAIITAVCAFVIIEGL